MRTKFGLLTVLVFGTIAGACASGGDNTDTPDAGSLLPLDAGKKDAVTDAKSDAKHTDGSIVGTGEGGTSDTDAGDEDATTQPKPDAGKADTGTTLPDATSSGGAPVADGVISANEYGVHTDGQNMQSSATSTWYMTWDDTNLYVGITGSDVTEGVVLYLDTNPMVPPTSGTNGEGSLVGQDYDSTYPTSLPFRADFVAYIKSTYNEARLADGLNAWLSPTTSVITQVGSGTTREIVVPWSTIHIGGRPTAFSWLGYVTSATGYVYGQMPTLNPGGTIGENATFTNFYAVADATPKTGTKPFAVQGP